MAYIDDCGSYYCLVKDEAFHFILQTVFRAKNSGRRPAHNKPLLKPVSCIFGDLMEFGSVLRGVAELRGPWPMYICDCEQSTLATAIADKRRW